MSGLTIMPWILPLSEVLKDTEVWKNNLKAMQKTELTFQINCMTLIFLGITIALFCSCNYSGQISGKENQGNQIVLIISDTLSFDFLRQQKASLKYINDESLPVTIGFLGTPSPIIGLSPQTGK
ncbi:hypothetical protein [Nitritalea halalkaliphila]|nr:hypothetical protein [Nitritalea halalkaliphila]